MNRIAIRLVSLVSLGLLGSALTSACASEESAFQGGVPDASIVVGSGGAAAQQPLPGSGGAPSTTPPGCDPSFCRSMGTGTGCCMGDGTCGVDYGMGCVASTTAAPDAG